MQKIIYSRGSNVRKRKYALMTQIVEENENISVLKIALNETAQKHVSKILEDYSKIKLPKPFFLVKPKLVKPGVVELPFISGENLEATLLKALRNRNNKVVLELFKLVENLMLSSTTQQDATKQRGYVENFGGSYGGTRLCSSIGLIDLNFDNFVQKGDQVYIVDYEWYYDTMAIPVDYLMSRLLYYTFAVKFRDTVKYTITAEHPVVEVFNEYLIPEFVYKKYKKYVESTYLMLDTERFVQNNILLLQNNTTGTQESYSLKKITEPSRTYVEEVYLEKLGLKQERDLLIEQSNEKNAHIRKLEVQVDEISKRINRIYGNPIVRVIKKIRRLLIKILPRS